MGYWSTLSPTAAGGYNFIRIGGKQTKKYYIVDIMYYLPLAFDLVIPLVYQELIPSTTQSFDG